MITELILAERLKRGISYSRKGRHISDQETEPAEVQRRDLPDTRLSASLPDPPTPLPSPPIRTLDSDLVQPETDDSPPTRNTASPPTTVRPRISTSRETIKDDTSPLIPTVVQRTTSTYSVIHIPSSPSSSSSSSWDTREANLTGTVHLHQPHKVYDGPYSTVYRGIYGDEYVAIKVVKSIRPPHLIRRVHDLGV